MEIICNPDVGCKEIQRTVVDDVEPVWPKNSTDVNHIRSIAMRNTRWLRLLAYVTGSVNQEFLLRNGCSPQEYKKPHYPASSR
jgi:hypothetical protein